MIQDVQAIAKTTLANCAAFRTLTATADATAALAKIYHDAWPVPASGGVSHSLAEITALRPSAIIYTEPDRGWTSQRDAMGDSTGNCWHHSGIIHMIIFRNVPTADKALPSKVDTDFRTVIGTILSELIAQSETAGRLNSKRLTVSGPWRTEPKELKDIGDAQGCEIIVEWGPG